MAQFVQLAGAEIGGGVRGRTGLDDRGNDLCAGSAGQFPEFPY